jgi:hypothetical protein
VVWMAVGVLCLLFFPSTVSAQGSLSGPSTPKINLGGSSIFGSLIGNPSNPNDFSFFRQRSHFGEVTTKDPIEAFDQLKFNPVESIFNYDHRDEIYDKVSFETLRLEYRLELMDLDDPSRLYTPLAFEARGRREDIARDMTYREMNELFHKIPQTKRIREHLIPYSKALQIYKDKNGFFNTDLFERKKRSALSEAGKGDHDPISPSKSFSILGDPVFSMNLLFSTKNSFIYKFNIFSQFSVSYLGDDRIRMRWSKKQSNFTISYEEHRMNSHIFQIGYLF